MLRFLNTQHKRKSAAITAVIMTMLIVAMFFVGMRYLDPPEEYGIAVNFGTSNFGKGNQQPVEPIKSSVSEEIPEDVPEEVEEVKTQSEPEKVQAKTEEVATQDTEEAIAIKKEKEAKRKQEEAIKKKKAEEERLERERQRKIAKRKAEERAKKAKLDALIGGINNSKGTASGGEGDDNVAGDKGKITGDPNASGYYGNAGSGGNGDYQLGRRKPLVRPKPRYICNEEGLVIVRIEVDKNGRVIKATPGVKGSTNTADCLLSQAKAAALKTKWQSDSNAPSKQVGTIKYRFSLSQ
ncbi:energy transducer TonB [Lutibacter sp.]